MTVLDPVGVGESQALALSPVAKGPRGATSSELSGSFALDGADGRTVSVASSAAPLTHANRSSRLPLNVRASRTGTGFDMLGGVTAPAGAEPGLYAGSVAVVVNYN